MYVLLVALALRNIWVILIRQQKYRLLPILAFYAFALVALTLRPIYMMGRWTTYPIFFNMDKVQQVAKLCVGIVQDWITLELAIRIHSAKGSSDISTAAKKRLRLAFAFVFIGLIIGFIAWNIAVYVSACVPGNYGYAFVGDYCFLFDVMALLVAWLFIETFRLVARERRAVQAGFASQNLHKERCTYAIISTFFTLSYIGRFVYNRFAYGCGLEAQSLFAVYMGEVACFFFEGASMGVLMYFHRTNFKQGGLFASEELAYVSI